MSPNELKKALSTGLLSFPLTDFDSELRFEPKGYANRLEWLMPYGATVLFAAGGTGEFFSLEPQEYAGVIKTAAETCKGRVPIVGGAGGFRCSPAPVTARRSLWKWRRPPNAPAPTEFCCCRPTWCFRSRTGLRRMSKLFAGQRALV